MVSVCPWLQKRDAQPTRNAPLSICPITAPKLHISLPRLVPIRPIADILTFSRPSRLFSDASTYHGNGMCQMAFSPEGISRKNRNHQDQDHLTFTLPFVAADEQLACEEDCP